MVAEKENDKPNDFVSSAYQRAVEETGISVPLKVLTTNVMEPGYVYGGSIQDVIEPFETDLFDDLPQEERFLTLYAMQQFREQLLHARFPGDEPTAAAMIAATVNGMPKGIAEDRNKATVYSRLLSGMTASLYNIASLTGEEKEVALWRFQHGLRNSYEKGTNPALWQVYNNAVERMLGDMGLERYIDFSRKKASDNHAEKLIDILEQLNTRRRIPEAMEQLSDVLFWYSAETEDAANLGQTLDAFAKELGYDPTFLVPLGNAAYIADERRRNGNNVDTNPDVLKAVLDVSETSQQRVNAFNAVYDGAGEKLLYRAKGQGLPRMVIDRPEMDRMKLQRAMEVPDTVIIIDTDGMPVEPGHAHQENGEYHKALLAAEGVAQLIIGKGGRVMPLKRTPDRYAVDAFTGDINDVENAFLDRRPATYSHEAVRQLVQGHTVVYIGNAGGPDGLDTAIVYHINPGYETRKATDAGKNSVVHRFDSDETPPVVFPELRSRGTPARGYVSIR